VILTFGERQEQDDLFKSALEEQLQLYSTASVGNDGSHQRQKAGDLAT
jgi:hypothetical protein